MSIVFLEHYKDKIHVVDVYVMYNVYIYIYIYIMYIYYIYIIILYIYIYYNIIFIYNGTQQSISANDYQLGKSNLCEHKSKVHASQEI